MDNLPLGTEDGARGALSVTRVTTFVGLCAFITAIQLFDNVIILENTTAFNNALYTILAQAALLAVLGGIGMARAIRLPRALVMAAGIVAAAGALLSVEVASTGIGMAAAVTGGLALALLSIAWGNRLAMMDARRVIPLLALAMLAGSLLCFGCFLAPARIAEGALFAALLLACLPWAMPARASDASEQRFAERSPSGKTKRDSRRFTLPVSALVMLGACCLVCAFFSGATLNPYAIQSSTVARIAHVTTIAAFALAAVACRARARLSLNGALLVTLALLLGGLLMLSTGIAGTVVVPIGVIGAARTLLWAVSFAVLTAIASAHPDRATGVFGLGLLVGNGALVRGMGIVASGTAHASFTGLALVGVAAIVAIALAYALMNASPQAARTLAIGIDLGFKLQNEQASADSSANVSADDPETAPIAEASLAEPFAAIGLTEKEMQVAALIADNRTYGDIAGKLGISERTVKFHAANIYHKAGVSTKADFRDKLRQGYDGRLPL